MGVGDAGQATRKSVTGKSTGDASREAHLHGAQLVDAHRGQVVAARRAVLLLLRGPRLRRAVRRRSGLRALPMLLLLLPVHLDPVCHLCHGAWQSGTTISLYFLRHSTSSEARSQQYGACDKQICLIGVAAEGKRVTSDLLRSISDAHPLVQRGVVLPDLLRQVLVRQHAVPQLQQLRVRHGR